ncbi:helix-turn-helix domain-containing protein [Candidatus Kaiserbacteria bacterium]|nr:helix-turn-helix domain-containing protein [Candidatus Kaiserbacteria bacterium]
MSDDLTIAGKSYISSKRAAELCGYTQDYIGQLARAGFIDAQRIGGLWYVVLNSLEEYKSSPDLKPEIQKYLPKSEPDTIVTLEGKDYVSASRAAKLTGYNQDYVGQLARSGQIFARQVGNRWYIDREAILAHKNEKEALLASVQAESVGLAHPPPRSLPDEGSKEAIMNYSSDAKDLFPVLESRSEPIHALEMPYEQAPIDHRITIRVIKSTFPTSTYVRPDPVAYQPDKKAIFPMLTLAGATLTVVIVLSVGLVSLGGVPIFASKPGITRTMPASAVALIDSLGSRVEKLLTRELVYRRQ